MTSLADMTLRDVVKLIKKHGSGRKAAQALDVPRTTFQDRVQALKMDRFSERKARAADFQPRPAKGKVKRFIFSSAQDGTKVHERFLANLEAYAKFVDATIHIAGFTYNKNLFDGSKTTTEFHPSITPYLTSNRIDVGGKLLFCGEMNISPTATEPLSGFETYTRKKWGVFPHPRVQLQSVATMFNEPAKIIMTTGSVTMPNYIQKKAGIKAEFHHIIGAVIVEIDDAGRVFARHILAEPDGSFQDLRTYVSSTIINTSAKVEAITWGDIHAEQIDKDVADGCFSSGGMLDQLGPDVQFLHDVSDFTARNHHTIKNPHERFKLFSYGQDSVEDGIEEVRKTIEAISRPWCDTVVVQSNHDDMLKRWLAEGDYRNDPVNAIFFLEQQLALYRAMHDGDDAYHPLMNALYGEFEIGAPDRLTFLDQTDSYKIVDDTIECGLHGHKGSNGAKGNIKSFARMGSKANVAHTHSAGIFEGIYQAGTCSKLDLGYNRGGLSSWNHSHIVVYPNGKRCIVTMQGSKWCA